jgi:4-hydroxybenzoate polyprenyltransferase
MARAMEPVAESAPGRTAASPRDWLTSLRPRQWVKNAAVLAAALFGHRLADPAGLTAALTAVAVFCCLGSSTYLVNDLVDRERDRRHPTKSRRPIAAGRVAPAQAMALAAALAVAGLGLAASINLPTALCGAAYLALQAAYTGWLKHVVILDVGAIAAGFVLRVVTGAVAVAVPISNWLHLCTLLLALFLALGKRRQELVLLEGDARGHRDVLAHYSVGLIDQLTTVVTACLLLAYALYTVAPETVAHVRSDAMKFTVPIVIYGVFRYLYLVHRRGAGGAPERVLLGDAPILLTCVLYAATAAAILYL